MILLIDNYDSFVFNLARYFEQLGQTTRVVRNDAITISEIRRLAPAAMVLSPGPCRPEQAGISLDVVRRLSGQFPILGVCLGHQAIAEAFGAAIVRAPIPMHGRTSEISHEGRSVFSGLPNPLTVCRYHSLVVEPSTLPTELEVTARTTDGIIMGLQHRQFPVVGVQFHPEAILTQCGFAILERFLNIAGIAIPPNHAAPAPELASAPITQSLPTTPVTF